MMLLNVVAHSAAQAREITIYLLENKFVAQASIGEKELYELNSDHELQGSKQYVIKGISKALLFDTINKKLRKKYQKRMPTLFAEPLIYMDFEQNKEFLERIVKV
ncbi:hypothetical protein GCM10011344_02920 [Dokdonia pacifica]|uniref:Divalent cation tolerance protein n=1 Tax=Dokdonia pacifica TaxID=1627892 RepID=A0A238ZFR4_9FLAO|nr:hypothetical protein [Dokdonia pacifica]GGG05879.1 hypothetical protein GCM10011344_02920 [Dokdonia pacifica]SNR81553.1 hypothetical protein SAMN06265376_103152 [Dokdonia pacifica]